MIGLSRSKPVNVSAARAVSVACSALCSLHDARTASTARALRRIGAMMAQSVAPGSSRPAHGAIDVTKDRIVTEHRAAEQPRFRGDHQIDQANIEPQALHAIDDLFGGGEQLRLLRDLRDAAE